MLNYLFVYGSLKSKKVQKELFGKILKSEEAEIIDYALYEAEDGFYFIKEKEKSLVKGFILEISDYDLKICDAFEECPEMYIRQNKKIKINGKNLEAYVYIRKDNVGKYKIIENFDSYSKLTEKELIEEVRIFKKFEHPEFYEKGN